MGLPASAADTGTAGDTCDGTLTGCDGFYYTDANKVNWTAQGLKKVADDLSVNGTSSKYYEQFHRNLDNTATPMAEDGSVKDSRGAFRYGPSDIVTFRLIGINHDVKADGTGKTGLSFMTMDSRAIPGIKMNVTYTTSGGWRDSQLRHYLNEDVIWAGLPDNMRENLTSVIKSSNNEGYNTVEPSGTIDSIWLLSYSEFVGSTIEDYQQYPSFHAHIQSGIQYEFFNHKVTGKGDNLALNSKNISARYSLLQLRPTAAIGPLRFDCIDQYGNPNTSCTPIEGQDRGIALGFAF